MKYLFKNFKNSIDFFLRKKLKFSRKNYMELNEPKDALFNSDSIIEKEKYLLDKYSLHEFKNKSTKINYCENLYLLDLLDKFLEIDCRNSIKILDIGSKNWAYAYSEHSFFRKHCSDFKLDGIEIDKNRLYRNLYTRGEVAKYHIKNLEKCKYIEGDFLEHEEIYDYIIWILPFMVSEPHLNWGLPLKNFNPEDMLKHAVDSLNKNGKMFIINQSEAEYKIQKELYKKLDINYSDIGLIKSEFYKFKFDRYLTIANN